jgi:hypothetical protein
MAVIWLPIANDAGVLGAGGAMHAPIMRRVRENYAERIVGHVYHAGAHAWPVGLQRDGGTPPGFRLPDVGTDPATQGVQASTHPAQWLCCLEWEIQEQWATLRPEDWYVRLHVCAVARNAGVHLLLSPTGPLQAVGQIGEPSAETLAAPGYLYLPPQAADADPDVVTLDIPLDEFGGVGGQAFGRPERQFRLWMLSQLGTESAATSGILSVSDDRRVLTIGSTAGDRWRKGHAVLRLISAGRVDPPEGGPSPDTGVILAPGAQTLHLIMATDLTSTYIVYPSVAEVIAQALTEDDQYALSAVGLLVMTSAHVELVPRRVVEMAGGGTSS